MFITADLMIELGTIMTQYTYYHNPRCSKSRQALTILNEHGIQPTIINYLETPPSKILLQTILTQLGISARQLLRKGEEQYKQLKLDDESLSEETLIDAMVKHPILIERPIVIAGNKAIIARPPEKVLTLL